MDSCTLPYDIVHRVVQSVDSMDTLLALITVCHELKQEAEPLLWRYLDVRFSDTAAMTRCMCICAENDHRGGYVRALRIDFGLRLISLQERAPVIQRAVATLSMLLLAAPNVETLFLISEGLGVVGMDLLSEALSSSDILCGVREIFVGHSTGRDSGDIVSTFWRTHPSLLATHIRQQYQLPFDKKPTVRPAALRSLGACDECPWRGTPLDDGGHPIPCFTADHVEDLRNLLVEHHIQSMPAAPQYGCLTFGAIRDADVPMIRAFSQVRTLHLTSGSLGSPNGSPAPTLDALETLEFIEELVWSRSGDIPAQEAFFERDKQGRIPSSLRRVCFTWSDVQKLSKRVYTKDKDPFGARWALVVDESGKRRLMFILGQSSVRVVTNRHAEL